MGHRPDLAGTQRWPNTSVMVGPIYLDTATRSRHGSAGPQAPQFATVVFWEGGGSVGRTDHHGWSSYRSGSPSWGLAVPEAAASTTHQPRLPNGWARSCRFGGQW